MQLNQDQCHPKTPAQKKYSKHKSQDYVNERLTSRGFGLIEVLIAIVIFAAGVLGVAGMQLNGLSMLSNSNALNTAVVGAADMADRIRANPLGLESGAYDNVNGKATVSACQGTCTPDQIAKQDAAEILAQLQTNLISPNLTVLNANNGLYTVEVSWTEKENADWSFADNVVGENTQSHRFTFLPQ